MVQVDDNCDYDSIILLTGFVTRSELTEDDAAGGVGGKGKGLRTGLHRHRSQWGSF